MFVSRAFLQSSHTLYPNFSPFPLARCTFGRRGLLTGVPRRPTLPKCLERPCYRSWGASFVCSAPRERLDTSFLVRGNRAALLWRPGALLSLCGSGAIALWELHYRSWGALIGRSPSVFVGVDNINPANTQELKLEGSSACGSRRIDPREEFRSSSRISAGCSPKSCAGGTAITARAVARRDQRTAAPPDLRATQVATVRETHSVERATG